MGMKTAVSMPDSLFQAADALAERMGISRSLLYRRAVEQYLKAQGEDIIRESLDELYESEDTSRLDPAVEFLQERSIDSEKDDW
jgi:metal-responsive CopG/Arc/MetJ family transcriptional regulator